jgi:hypothetical protein
MVNILDTQNEGHPIEAPTVPHSVPPFKMASVATTKLLEWKSEEACCIITMKYAVQNC